ncbi:hypothetical protein HYFRA_00005885 [Hymenoscyphus fraxineus]|uniref:PHD-type domain-containing protein n=1 Tax=Hymenoscyphus fraxineus TaxID=746836 RepID=A0A9N9KU23_9HELO|nr:hypothetical protein HYFRA_00005885 [Hymenoscyphus fraxineus]
MDPNELSQALSVASPVESFNEAPIEPPSTSFSAQLNSSPQPPPEVSAPSLNNNRPGFKYKYPEAAPTPPGEDDAEWNKVYTAADSRFYNRNGKNAEKSRKFRQAGDTYQLALVMMAEKKEKMKAGTVAPNGRVVVPKSKAAKKPATVVKKEPSSSSRDVTPGGMGIPLSISEQIKANGRAAKAPSAAPSSKQGTPVPSSSKMGSPPPPAPKLDRPPPKKKGTAALVKKHARPKGPERPILPPIRPGQTPVPKTNNASDSDSNDGGEYCVCRGPDDHRMMVNCEGGCDEWYHCSCINMVVEDAKELLDRYICPRCQTDELFTTWKRMCRYNNVGEWMDWDHPCRKAARVTEDPPSKYCSDEHRDEFWRFVRDNLARTDQAPSMGGRLNVQEVADILDHCKDNSQLQNLGKKPRLPIPEGYDSKGRPIGLEYVTPEGKAELENIEKKKKIIEQRIENCVLQQQLLRMVHARASAAAEHPECAEKGLCGYDNRLSFNEEEFAHWLTTTEGKTAFESGKLGPRTEETKTISNRIIATDQVSTNGAVLPDELNNICLARGKGCVKHRQWRAIHSLDFSTHQGGLKLELDRLTSMANEIIEDAEGREAEKEYHAHNTVEVLF